MTEVIKMEVKPYEIIEAVKKMKKKDRDSFLEDLLAATFLSISICNLLIQ